VSGRTPRSGRRDRRGDRGRAEFEPIGRSKAEVVVPPKKPAILIRLDQDLVDFFKTEGPGYRRRIDAVLRRYMRARRR
jgi:uncharacterized protein (DUF4415 family)